jgi:hypothetical protein
VFTFSDKVEVCNFPATTKPDVIHLAGNALSVEVTPLALPIHAASHRSGLERFWPASVELGLESTWPENAAFRRSSIEQAGRKASVMVIIFWMFSAK